MDQRGGCCIARYDGGAYDMSKVDRIMLRFRPIAPKPASTNGSLSGGVSGGSSALENSGTAVRTRRGRRRRASKDSRDSSVKKKKNGIGSRKRKAVSSGGKVVKTLPLMPETPEAEEGKKTTGYQSRDRRNRRPLWLNFGSGGESEVPAADRFDLGYPMAAVKEAEVGRRVLVWSWVRVECVTDTCAVGCYGYGNLGRTDEERMRSLDLDTCPGLISDGLNRVRWMNAEYRRMVGGEGAGSEGEIVAWVVVGEGVKMPAAAAAFTCQVKVVAWEKEKKSQTLPCDVWRMDCGGFAWRLDTTAALSLSL